MTPPPEKPKPAPPWTVERIARRLRNIGINECDGGANEAAPPNRWAAFTDNELHELDRALDSEWPLPHDIDIRVDVLGRGVRDELERRKAADGR